MLKKQEVRILFLFLYFRSKVAQIIIVRKCTMYEMILHLNFNFWFKMGVSSKVKLLKLALFCNVNKSNFYELLCVLNNNLKEILLITKCLLSFSMRFVAKLQISKIAGIYQSQSQVENVAGINRSLRMHPQKRNQLGIKKPPPLSLVGMKHPVMPRVARLLVLLPQLECGMLHPVILQAMPLQVRILKSKYNFNVVFSYPRKAQSLG